MLWFASEAILGQKQSRTRSRVNKVEVIKPSHFQSETAVSSNDHACVGNESQSVGYTSSKTQLLLQIPNSVTGVTKHFEDFVKCDSMEAADVVKEAMKLQWSSLIMPGKEVKVKLTGCRELSSAVVVECYYTSKLSFDCLYYYATAKADVRLHGSNRLREFQFWDLIL